MRQLRILGEEFGSVGKALRVLFRLSNVSVDVVDEGGAPSTVDGAALFVGDHRSGFEVAPLLAAFAAAGCEDLSFLAKPFATTIRLMVSAGLKSENFLPVIPGTLAQDRENIWNRDLGWRVIRRGSLPARSELAQLNAQALQKGVRLLSNGRGVVLFPAGGVVDGLVRPWLPGVGRMLKLAHDMKIDAPVVFFRFDDFSSTTFASSLVAQSYGFTPSPMRLVLRIVKYASIGEFVGASECRDPSCLTLRLQSRFKEVFSDSP